MKMYELTWNLIQTINKNVYCKAMNTNIILHLELPSLLVVPIKEIISLLSTLIYTKIYRLINILMLSVASYFKSLFGKGQT